MEKLITEVVKTNNSDALIVIPTYNEIENIEMIIRKIVSLEYSFDILVVDDNSKDGTGEKVEELIFELKNRLYCIHRECKLGLGTAYIAGFKWALNRDNYKYIFEMDADFSHDPNDLPRFIKEIQKADLVIGSRFYEWRLNVINWPIKRLILSLIGSQYIRLVLGKIGVYDITGGFKCFKRKVLETIDLDNIKSTGFSFQVELNYKTIRKGFTIKEIPIIFKDRELGTSKMSKGIIKEALIVPIKLKLGLVFTNHKKK